MRKTKTLLCLMAIVCMSLFAIFLTGCGALDQLKCEHEWGAVVTLEPSTCTEKGKGEKTCKLCNKVETVKLDYEHVPITIEAIKPTCSQKGRTDYKVCYSCEKVLVPYAELSPTGHKVVKDEAVEATCLQDGLTEGEHCEVCEAVLLEQKKITATGHTIVYYPEQEPTCTEAGYTAGEVCKNCGAYDSREEIPALGHNIVTLDRIEPTCTESGKTEGTLCITCNRVLSHGKIIPALGHDYSDGNICANCGHGKTISLYDLKRGDNLYGYQLVFVGEESELSDALYASRYLSGYYIEDDNEFDYSLISVGIEHEELEIWIYGNLVFSYSRFEQPSLIYNEVFFNEALGFSSYFVDEVNSEMDATDRLNILTLFEFVYVGA